MNTAPASNPISGVTTWMSHPQGRQITCALGTLWLRVNDEGDGVVLRAGQSHRCHSAAPLAIHASVSAAMLVD